MVWSSNHKVGRNFCQPKLEERVWRPSWTWGPWISTRKELKFNWSRFPSIVFFSFFSKWRAMACLSSPQWPLPVASATLPPPKLRSARPAPATRRFRARRLVVGNGVLKVLACPMTMVCPKYVYWNWGTRNTRKEFLRHCWSRMHWCNTSQLLSTIIANLDNL